MDKCVHCGELGVVDEDENGQNVRVCTECGTLQNNSQQLVSSHDFVGTTLTDGTTRGPSTKRCWMSVGESTDPASKKEGEKTITELGNSLRLREDMINEALSLFHKTFSKHVYHCAKEKRLAMCQACVYAVAKMNNVAISIRDLTHCINGTKLFSQRLAILKEEYNVHLPNSDMFADIERWLSHKDFTRQLQELTLDIMNLLDKMWITTGRLKKPYLIISAFIAWKSSNLAQRSKKRLSYFCKQFDLQLKKTQVKKYPKVYSALLSLVGELPWVSDAVEGDVEAHIKQVVQYQKTLLQEAIATYVSKRQAEEGTEDAPGEENDECQKNGQKVIQEHGNLFRQYPAHKRPLDISVEPGNIKKQRRTDDASNSDDDSDLERVLGSDDDTDMYIKSESEVNLSKQMWNEYVE